MTQTVINRSTQRVAQPIAVVWAVQRAGPHEQRNPPPGLARVQ